jgi:hypothetical protein
MQGKQSPSHGLDEVRTVEGQMPCAEREDEEEEEGWRGRKM